MLWGARGKSKKTSKLKLHNPLLEYRETRISRGSRKILSREHQPRDARAPTMLRRARQQEAGTRPGGGRAGPVPRDPLLSSRDIPQAPSAVPRPFSSAARKNTGNMGEGYPQICADLRRLKKGKKDAFWNSTFFFTITGPLLDLSFPQSVNLRIKPPSADPSMWRPKKIQNILKRSAT